MKPLSFQSVPYIKTKLIMYFLIKNKELENFAKVGPSCLYR